MLLAVPLAWICRPAASSTNEITLISDNSRMMIKSKNIKLKDINEIVPGTFEKIDFDKNKIYIWGMAVWVIQEI